MKSNRRVIMYMSIFMKSDRGKKVSSLIITPLPALVDCQRTCSCKRGSFLCIPRILLIYMHGLFEIVKTGDSRKRSGIEVSKIEELLRRGGGNEEEGDESSESNEDGNDDPFAMDDEERKEWRLKITEVIGRLPDCC